MRSLEELAVELRAGGVADPAEELGPYGPRILRPVFERHRERGLHAYVVRAEPGRPLDEVWPLWSKLGLNEESDLLLLYNGTRWEAKGWGLSAAQISQALAAAEPALQRSQTEGLALVLDKLAELVPLEIPWLPLSMHTAALTWLGWVLVRKFKRHRQSKQRIAKALSSAAAVQAEVMLAAEQLPTDAAAKVQRHATRLGEEFQPAAQSGDEALAVGRLEQLESELNALHSEVLARTRRGQGG